MNKDEAIIKIKDQLKKLMSFSTEAPAEEAEATEEKKFTTMKLKDGTEISIVDGTELGVGTEVFTVDADGNQVAIADDTYELEDGRSIVIVGGKVDSISESTEETKDETPMNPADTEVKDEKMGENPEGEEAQEGENPIEDRITSLENQIAQILEILQGMGSMQEVAMSKIEAISSAPATESIKVGKIPAGNQTFSSMKTEMDELKEMRNKFKLNGNGGYSFNAAKTNNK